MLRPIAWAARNRRTLILGSGLVLGWAAILAAPALPPGYRETASFSGWMAFAAAWTQLSPCASGRCGVSMDPGRGMDGPGSTR